MQEKKNLYELKRYRHYSYFKNIQAHLVCKYCSGFCCALDEMEVQLTFVEVLMIKQKQLNLKVSLNVYYQDVDILRLNKRYLSCGGSTGNPQMFKNGKYVVAWHLAKKANGECIYFSSSKRKCSIYSTRPHACKCWFCGANETPKYQDDFDKLLLF